MNMRTASYLGKIMSHSYFAASAGEVFEAATLGRRNFGRARRSRPTCGRCFGRHHHHRPDRQEHASLRARPRSGEERHRVRRRGRRRHRDCRRQDLHGERKSFREWISARSAKTPNLPEKRSGRLCPIGTRSAGLPKRRAHIVIHIWVDPRAVSPEPAYRQQSPAPDVSFRHMQELVTGTSAIATARASFARISGNSSSFPVICKHSASP